MCQKAVSLSHVDQGRVEKEQSPVPVPRPLPTHEHVSPVQSEVLCETSPAESSSMTIREMVEAVRKLKRQQKLMKQEASSGAEERPSPGISQHGSQDASGEPSWLSRTLVPPLCQLTSADDGEEETRTSKNNALTLPGSVLQRGGSELGAEVPELGDQGVHPSESAGCSLAEVQSSESAGRSLAEMQSSESAGRSLAAGQSSTSAGRSLAEVQSSESAGHSLAEVQSSESAGRSLAAGQSSTSAGRSLAAGQSSESAGRSLAAGQSSESAGRSLAAGQSSESAAHAQCVLPKSKTRGEEGDFSCPSSKVKKSSLKRDCEGSRQQSSVKEDAKGSKPKTPQELATSPSSTVWGVSTGTTQRMGKVVVSTSAIKCSKGQSASGLQDHAKEQEDSKRQRHTQSGLLQQGPRVGATNVPSGSCSDQPLSEVRETNTPSADQPPSKVSGTNIPPGSCSDQSPSKVSGTNIPSGSYSDQSPSKVSGTNIPSGSYLDQPPSKVSGTNVPPGSYLDQPPSKVSGTNVPPGSYLDQPPSKVSVRNVPSGSCSDQPPSKVSVRNVPSGSCSDQPPSEVRATNVPSGSCSDQPPSEVRTTNVPSGSCSDQPPSEVRATNVPAGSCSDQPPSEVRATNVPSGSCSDQPPSEVRATNVPSGSCSDQPPSEVRATNVPSGSCSDQPPSEVRATNVPAGSCSDQPPSKVPAPTETHGGIDSADVVSETNGGSGTELSLHPSLREKKKKLRKERRKKKLLKMGFITDAQSAQHSAPKKTLCDGPLDSAVRLSSKLAGKQKKKLKHLKLKIGSPGDAQTADQKNSEDALSDKSSDPRAGLPVAPSCKLQKKLKHLETHQSCGSGTAPQTNSEKTPLDESTACFPRKWKKKLKLLVKSDPSDTKNDTRDTKSDCRDTINTKSDCRDTKSDCRDTKSDSRDTIDTKSDCRDTKSDSRDTIDTKSDCRDTKNNSRVTKSDCRDTKSDSRDTIDTKSDCRDTKSDSRDTKKSDQANSKQTYFDESAVAADSLCKQKKRKHVNKGGSISVKTLDKTNSKETPDDETSEVGAKLPKQSSCKQKKKFKRMKQKVSSFSDNQTAGEKISDSALFNRCSESRVATSSDGSCRVEMKKNVWKPDHTSDTQSTDQVTSQKTCDNSNGSGGQLSAGCALKQKKKLKPVKKLKRLKEGRLTDTQGAGQIHSEEMPWDESAESRAETSADTSSHPKEKTKPLIVDHTNNKVKKKKKLLKASHTDNSPNAGDNSPNDPSGSCSDQPPSEVRATNTPSGSCSDQPLSEAAAPSETHGGIDSADVVSETNGGSGTELSLHPSLREKKKKLRKERRKKKLLKMGFITDAQSAQHSAPKKTLCDGPLDSAVRLSSKLAGKQKKKLKHLKLKIGSPGDAQTADQKNSEDALSDKSSDPRAGLPVAPSCKLQKKLKHLETHQSCGSGTAPQTNSEKTPLDESTACFPRKWKKKLKLLVKSDPSDTKNDTRDTKSDCRDTINTKSDCRDTKSDCRDTKNDSRDTIDTKSDCRDTKSDSRDTIDTKSDCRDTKNNSRVTKSDCRDTKSDSRDTIDTKSDCRDTKSDSRDTKKSDQANSKQTYFDESAVAADSLCKQKKRKHVNKGGSISVKTLDKTNSKETPDDETSEVGAKLPKQSSCKQKKKFKRMKQKVSSFSDNQTAGEKISDSALFNRCSESRVATSSDGSCRVEMKKNVWKPDHTSDTQSTDQVTSQKTCDNSNGSGGQLSAGSNLKQKEKLKPVKKLKRLKEGRLTDTQSAGQIHSEEMPWDESAESRAETSADTSSHPKEKTKPLIVDHTNNKVKKKKKLLKASHTDNSPNAGDNSPNAGDNSPNAVDSSSNADDNSTNAVDNSPNAVDDSPNAGDNSPNAGDSCLNAVDNSPNADDNSPYAGDSSLNAVDNSPNAGDNSPNAGDSSLNAVDNSPNAGDNSTNADDSCLNAGDSCLNAGDNSTNADDSCLNAGDSCLNAGDNSTNADDSCLNAGDSCLNAGDNSTNAGDNSLNAVDNSPNAGVSSPNAGVSSPSAGVSSPHAGETPSEEAGCKGNHVPRAGFSADSPREQQRRVKPLKKRHSNDCADQRNSAGTPCEESSGAKPDLSDHPAGKRMKKRHTNITVTADQTCADITGGGSAEETACGHPIPCVSGIPASGRNNCEEDLGVGREPVVHETVVHSEHEPVVHVGHAQSVGSNLTMVQTAYSPSKIYPVPVYIGGTYTYPRPAQAEGLGSGPCSSKGAESSVRDPWSGTWTGNHTASVVCHLHTTDAKRQERKKDLVDWFSDILERKRSPPSRGLEAKSKKARLNSPSVSSSRELCDPKASSSTFAHRVQNSKQKPQPRSPILQTGGRLLKSAVERKRKSHLHQLQERNPVTGAPPDALPATHNSKGTGKSQSQADPGKHGHVASEKHSNKVKWKTGEICEQIMDSMAKVMQKPTKIFKPSTDSVAKVKQQPTERFKQTIDSVAKVKQQPTKIFKPTTDSMVANNLDPQDLNRETLSGCRDTTGGNVSDNNASGEKLTRHNREQQPQAADRLHRPNISGTDKKEKSKNKHRKDSKSEVVAHAAVTAQRKGEFITSEDNSSVSGSHKMPNSNASQPVADLGKTVQRPEEPVSKDGGNLLKIKSPRKSGKLEWSAGCEKWKRRFSKHGKFGKFSPQKRKQCNKCAACRTEKGTGRSDCRKTCSQCHLDFTRRGMKESKLGRLHSKHSPSSSRQMKRLCADQTKNAQRNKIQNAEVPTLRAGSHENTGNTQGSSGSHASCLQDPDVSTEQGQGVEQQEAGEDLLWLETLEDSCSSPPPLDPYGLADSPTYQEEMEAVRDRIRFWDDTGTQSDEESSGVGGGHGADSSVHLSDQATAAGECCTVQHSVLRSQEDGADSSGLSQGQCWPGVEELTQSVEQADSCTENHMGQADSCTENHMELPASSVNCMLPDSSAEPVTISQRCDKLTPSTVSVDGHRPALVMFASEQCNSQQATSMKPVVSPHVMKAASSTSHDKPSCSSPLPHKAPAPSLSAETRSTSAPTVDETDQVVDSVSVSSGQCAGSVTTQTTKDDRASLAVLAEQAADAVPQPAQHSVAACPVPAKHDTSCTVQAGDDGAAKHNTSCTVQAGDGAVLSSRPAQDGGRSLAIPGDVKPGASSSPGTDRSTEAPLRESIGSYAEDASAEQITKELKIIDECLKLLRALNASAVLVDAMATVVRDLNDILDGVQQHHAGRPHTRLPDELLLPQERHKVYTEGGSFVILLSSIPRDAYVQLREVKDRIASCGSDRAGCNRLPQQNDSIQKLRALRKNLLQTFTGSVTESRLQEISRTHQGYSVCKNYLLSFLGQQKAVKMTFVNACCDAVHSHLQIVQREVVSSVGSCQFSSPH